ncbi:unnamed protein product [Acanthoscelides obtectus]|uniref:RING-type domain-containing protein n=1 Tax=Acanthoscelides obtectus TaxID=200917 RepID=A0A9P0PRI6_ACAOB|nr:unnamed protein product [Acanthoscelides obtectus]CAK1635653.1 RING finger and transmembrane domain-containing protein 2 [Acanthoscelides obtectus]
MSVPGDTNIPDTMAHSFQRSQSADLSQPQHQSRLLFTSHSSNALPSTAVSFHRRTVESARQLRDSFSNVIREIEPLVETARTVNAGVTSFLSSSNNSQLNNSPNARSDSIFINLDVPHEPPVRDPQTPAQENTTQERGFLDGQPSDNNNATEDPDRTQTVLEAQECIRILLKYVPFVLILLGKAVYDYHESIFILVILFVAFAHTNSVVRKEAVKRQRRSVSTLAVELLYIIACLIFIHYVFEDELHNFNLILNLVLIRTFTHPLTVWNLVWIVAITDFTLKLLTVAIKILLTMLPAQVVDFKKRGKIYLFIEGISQLYRSIATIQPWLYYLLESYQGPEKIVAVFLSAFYMISKGSDLMSKVKLLKTAFFKLLQNVSIGSSPSKDQIQTAGEHCPICHDEYDSPVLLQCRHIFCEACVSTWFDREQTCPLCRAKIVDDPSWRDGSTSYFVQLF